MEQRKPDKGNLAVVEITTFEWGTSGKLASTITMENPKTYPHKRLEASLVRG